MRLPTRLTIIIGSFITALTIVQWLSLSPVRSRVYSPRETISVDRDRFHRLQTFADFDQDQPRDETQSSISGGSAVDELADNPPAPVLFLLLTRANEDAGGTGLPPLPNLDARRDQDPRLTYIRKRGPPAHFV